MIRPVYLDTCCVIYLLEDVPPFSEQIRKHMTNNTDAILCVSPLVRLEALVKPIIDCNKQLLAWQLIFLIGKGKIEKDHHPLPTCSHPRQNGLLANPGMDSA